MVENAYDTAGSVKVIKDIGEKNLAAIASERAAGFYGMTVLKKGIQDSKENYTRFVVLSKKLIDFGNKFTLMLSLKHEPGSLLEILKIIEKYKINLTSIHSRPNKNRPFEYHFFLEGIFKKMDQKMFDDLKNKSKTFKKLGVYNLGL
jgi:prephenate dehydratase